MITTPLISKHIQDAFLNLNSYLYFEIEHLFDYQAIFEAKVGLNNYGDIALDDIILEDGPCQTPSKSTLWDRVLGI